MIALQTDVGNKRLTTSEEVFRQLKSDIISLSLLPGSKISEVEVAKAFDVSRQPVREAFLRLSALNLLDIRPQRATRVRKISHRDLRSTRFIRAAVEVEVVRQACHLATDDHLAQIQENLDQQRSAAVVRDTAKLKSLDYQFHNLICLAADRLSAFEVIAENKTHTDRVCTLELADDAGMAEVLEGHTAILDALRDKDEERAVAKTRIHLAHLDETLRTAFANYPDYFED